LNALVKKPTPGATHPARPAGRKLGISEAHQKVSAQFPKTLAELAK
jgi:hypothetical protein